MVLTSARLPISRLWLQILLATLLALVAVGMQWLRSGDLIGLFLTPDQQGRIKYEQRQFAEAADLFQDPMWKGVALAYTGRYKEAAGAFARVPTASGFYDRGNALMKSGDYGKAIDAYQLAVVEAPDWSEAQENLRLAKHVLEYIERLRVESDTGDESELSADEFKFDNTKKKGKEITITKDSTIELASAEKWMRSVDTETRDFLRVRFAMETDREEAP